MVGRVDIVEKFQWFVGKYRYRALMIQGSSIPAGVEEEANASPVALLQECASDWIPEAFPIKAIGKCLHPEELTVSRGSQVRLPPGVLERGKEWPAARNRGPVGYSHEMKQRPSWFCDQILSPLHLLEPIFVSRGQPHICLVTHNPGVQEVDEVGVSPVHGESFSSLKQRLR